MSEAFMGEIRMFPFGWAPRGWLQCNGQQLNIAEYDALFALIGKVYGGDGVSTFAIPNLNGRVPIHLSSTLPLATQVGSEQVTLIEAELGPHSHLVLASAAVATNDTPVGNVPAMVGGDAAYATTSTSSGGSATVMNASAISSQLGPSGGAHDNLQPFAVVNFCICVLGIYPPNPNS